MSRTILLADDSLTIQKVVELTFADTEYDVVAVSSGDELMQRLPEVRPDLVICDVIMPGRDGYDVCQEIKSSSQYLHLPVILLTGTFEPFDRDRAIAVGCSEIITKPFEAKKLVDAVERLAMTPGAPPPKAVDTQSIGPDDLSRSDAEVELDDTEISGEYGHGMQASGAATEEAAVEPDAFAIEGDSPISETTPVQPLEEFELGAVDEGMEIESMELPEVEAPPDLEHAADEAPDPARTLAAEDFSALVETEEMATAGGGEEPDMAAEPFADVAADEEPFPTDEHVAEAPRTGPEEGDRSLTTPIDVEAVMADHQPEVDFSIDDGLESEVDVNQDDADTQDFGDKPPAAAPSEEISATGLSDEDVDRIARRLLELAGDRIEHIAWDVIPDMAEVVVRERMREIEAETERKPS